MNWDGLDTAFVAFRRPKVLFLTFVVLVVLGVALGGIWLKLCLGLGIILFAVGVTGGILARESKGFQRVIDVLAVIFILAFAISVLLDR